MLNVLVACEESQTVCKAFRERGHNAFSCDLVACSGGHPEWHIISDCLLIMDGNCSFTTMDGVTHTINGKWDLVIAHPPCTYLSNVGARHTLSNGQIKDHERYSKGVEATEFFMKCLRCSCDHVCVENPTPMRVFHLPMHSQVIQPYYFGHPYSKRTLFWYRGLPLLKKTNVLYTYTPAIKADWFNRKLSESSLQRQRSVFWTGVADAMADQWGDYLERLKENESNSKM